MQSDRRRAWPPRNSSRSVMWCSQSKPAWSPTPRAQRHGLKGKFMTELETTLLMQFEKLSSACEQQLVLQAQQLSGYAQQLSLQSKRVEDLSLQVTQLIGHVDDLCKRLNDEP